MATTRKKLIEVALPLEAINKASAREKSIRHGHPSTLHLWWARRPLAAARAVIFAQMVDDPSGYVDTLKSDPKLRRKAEGILKARHKLWKEATAVLEKAKAAGINAPEPGPEPKLDDILAEIERQRLFRIIEELVLWENTTNEDVLQKAREEIWQSWRRTCAENAGHPRAKELFDRHKLPAFHDPFAGGGALPLEAQRLGLEAYASDLNPVAVLINKAMIEIPPKFAGRPPVHPPAKPRESLDLCGKNHVFSHRWDNLAPGGSGSVDVWEYNEGFYVATDGIDRSDDLDALEEHARTEGPFPSLEIILEQNIGGIRSLGPASLSVFSRRHSAVDLRGLLKIEPSLLEDEEELDEWKLTLNGVPHRAVVKTLSLECDAKGSAQTEMRLTREWRGAQGLAEDVRYYGKWMRDEAEKRIGHLYPKIEITAAMAQERPDLKPLVGRKLTVIAWLWARTVKSPNPAFSNVDVPLASTFMLSTKPGKEAWVEPVIEDGSYRFVVKVGKAKDAEAAKAGTKLGGRGANFGCLMSGTPIAADYIRTEAKAGRMGARLMAIVAEGDRGRLYLSPTPEHEAAAEKAEPDWKPEVEFFQQALGFRVGNYGMTKWSDLFTQRQLSALTTLSNLIAQTIERIRSDAGSSFLPNDSKRLNEGGVGLAAYSEAVAVYLSFALSKQADLGNSLCRWEPIAQCPRQLFGRQAIPMIWDYAEGNPLGESSGAWIVFVDGIVKAFSKSFESISGKAQGSSQQADAALQTTSIDKVVSTDPPYYDNIGYADLSDFFYVWMRRALKPSFPDLFATLAVPKTEELVATPDRHGGKEEAESFFLGGMTRAMRRVAEQSHVAFPVTIYYAFKQSESDATDGTASTGWETFLDAVIRAGFATSGTWPMRTENDSRMRGQTSNALASSIVLVCRPRSVDAPTATRREFVAALQRELPEALRHLQAGNIAPVDLAQAAIGPGMAVFTRYAQVLDAQGNAMRVREALALINETLDTALAEQEGDFDPDSRWALTWFEQMGFEEGEYGEAEKLSKAKNTSVSGLAEAGILNSSRGKVRLLKPDELPAEWDPVTDARLTSWETVHQLIRALGSGGEPAAAALVAKLGTKAETARELAYRLYTLCERKKRAAEALTYNGLVQSWPEIVRLAREGALAAEPTQAELF